MATIDYKIKQLRDEVKGHYGRIAQKSSVSLVTISLVLNGHYVNLKVIDAAIEVRDELRAEAKKAAEELEQKLS